MTRSTCIFDGFRGLLLTLALAHAATAQEPALEQPARLLGLVQAPALSLDWSDGPRLLRDGADVTADAVDWGRLSLVADSPSGDLLLLPSGTLVLDEWTYDAAGLRRPVGADRRRGTAWTAVEIPGGSVCGAVLVLPRDPVERDRWLDRVRDFQATHDRVWTVSGDLVDGRILAADGDGLRLVLAAGEGIEVSLPRERVRAWALGAAGSLENGDESAVLGCHDGSWLRLRSWQRAEDEWTLQLSSGGVVRAATAVLQRDVCYWQPPQPEVRWIADLPIADYRYQGVLADEWAVGRDRNVLGQRLQDGEGWYLRGCGLHAPCRVAYAVPAGHRWFRAELDLDPAAGDQGSVVCRLFGRTADDPQWRELFRSQVLRGADPPLPVQVDIRSQEYLVLAVDVADRGAVLDRVNWLRARLEP